MSPTAKDLDLTTPNSTTPGVRPASVGTQDENAGKPQPVPLEVPVTVNGARTVEGSDKREPFSETTQTVLVFGNGGVIRLASSVAAGQLLFLTNEKTKKEVVCQVVKSKNYRNVSGYVELEFTESVPGFWGMRFPGERVPAQPSASAPAAKPVAPSSVAPKIDAPAVNTVPQRVEPKVTPVQPALAPAATITTSALHADVKPTLNLPRAAEPRPVSAAPTPVSQSTVAPVNVAPHVPLPKAPGLTDGFGSGLTSTARPPDNRSLSSVVPKPPQSPVSQDSSDALLRESERLHEQLASMLFAAEVPATPVQATPVQPTAAPPPPHKPLTVDSLAKVVEIAKPQISAPKVVPPPKNAPIQMHSSLDDEQVKIPSWLEPLARNAATQAQNETVARAEAAASANRVIEFEVQDVSAPAIAQVEEVPATEVSHSHFVEEAITIQSASQRKNKVVLIGAIAAGVLLTAAGGTWYARRSSAPAQPAPAAVVASVPEVAASIAAPPAPHGSEKAAGRSVAEVSSPNRSNINSEPVAKPQGSSAQGNSQSITPASEVVKIAPDKNTAAELSAYKKLAEPQPQPEPKRSSLGTVRLSAPNANRNPVAPELGDADAGLSLSGTQVTPAGDAFGGGLVAGNSKQPVAPAAVLPIGGDVKPAHLLSSVPPAYPSLAKTQRIEGAVRIDAVVDPNGRISSMKVMSGPALLHQAAMDALHQWKYQPATLDGKPVPMHLTVTVQFRLQ